MMQNKSCLALKHICAHVVSAKRYDLKGLLNHLLQDNLHRSHFVGHYTSLTLFDKWKVNEVTVFVTP